MEVGLEGVAVQLMACTTVASRRRRAEAQIDERMCRIVVGVVKHKLVTIQVSEAQTPVGDSLPLQTYPTTTKRDFRHEGKWRSAKRTSALLFT